jgi:hypothetical protein
MPVFAYLEGMEVHFTPEQETQLSQIAIHAGTDAETGASSLKKKKWTPAWSRCCTPRAPSLPTGIKPRSELSWPLPASIEHS